MAEEHGLDGGACDGARDRDRIVGELRSRRRLGYPIFFLFSDFFMVVTKEKK